MTSIHFNSQARSAQRQLRLAEQASTAGKQRLSSGLRIATAKDNAAYWSVSRAMSGDVAALHVARDGLNQSLAVVDTAMAAASPVLKGLDRIKGIFTLGRQATPEEALLYDREIRSIADMLETTVKSASFGGVNLLYRVTGTAHARSFVGAVGRAGDGSLSVSRIVLDLNQTVLIDEDKTGGLMSMAYYDRFNYTTGRRLFTGYSTHAWLLAFYNSQTGALFNMGGRMANIDMIEQICTAVRDGFATLGAFQKRLETQRDFVEELAATQSRSIGRLVDVDLNQESARLRAEETRRKLAIQSLGIANNAPGLSLRRLLS